MYYMISHPNNLNNVSPTCLSKLCIKDVILCLMYQTKGCFVETKLHKTPNCLGYIVRKNGVGEG